MEKHSWTGYTDILLIMRDLIFFILFVASIDNYFFDRTV